MSRAGSPRPLVVVGDALLDRDITGRADRLSPDAPVPIVAATRETERPGGAALAALLAARDGRPVLLVTALGEDAAGERVAELLAAAGVTVVAARLAGRTPVKERVRVAGQSLLRIDREDPVSAVDAAGPLAAAVRGAGAVLAADYGRGLLATPELRSAVADVAHRVPVVWDPHPRGGPPPAGMRLVTPNLAEALAFAAPAVPPGPAGPADWPGGAGRGGAAGGAGGAGGAGSGGAAGWAGWAGGADPGGGAGPPGVPGPRHGRDPGVAAGAGAGRGGSPAVPGGAPSGPGGPGGSAVAVAARAGRALAGRWRAGGVAVTLGARGALLASVDDVPLVVPAPPAGAGDPCGAGDRFAAAVAGRLADGALPSEAVTAGVAAASAYVAAGGPASLRGPAPGPRPSTVAEVVARTRAAGGTVVATGGCFDLLHAGHVATLEAARRLGDCLVVLVNSDESVRRLKGPSRPLVPAADRVRVLDALGSVDAVAVFTEDTPLAVLDRIRPDVWVKGGDYTASALPETELLAGWGGEVVVVPYLEGRSTSRLAGAAAERTTTGRGNG